MQSFKPVKLIWREFLIPPESGLEELTGSLPATDSAVPFNATTTSTASPSSPSSSGGLAGIFNVTAPSNTTDSPENTSSPLGGLDMGQAAGAAGLTPQVTYSPAQLSALQQKYSFGWNAASYFVVTFAAVVLAIVLVFVVHHMIGGYRRQRRKARNVSNHDGESYLSRGRGRLRPNSRILAALKKGNISHPVPSVASESGHSLKATSLGEGASYAEGGDRFQGA